jgi:hypothetical protein
MGAKFFESALLQPMALEIAAMQAIPSLLVDPTICIITIGALTLMAIVFTAHIRVVFALLIFAKCRITK